MQDDTSSAAPSSSTPAPMASVVAQLPPSPCPAEAEIPPASDALHLHKILVEEGVDELHRTTGTLWWSGLAAGLTVTVSLIAEGALHNYVPDVGYAELVIALGYPFGFVLVILSKMQLFTESTVTAALPIALRPTKQTLNAAMRLWGMVIFANFIGTAIAAFLIESDAIVSPDIRNAVLEVAGKITGHSPLTTFITAIPAGFLIAMIPWAGPNAGDSKFWLIVMVTWLIGVAGFTHSVVGSAEAFVLLFAGKTGLVFTFVEFLPAAVLGNLVGGAGIFAILAHGQVKDAIAAKQAMRPANPAKRQQS